MDWPKSIMLISLFFIIMLFKLAILVDVRTGTSLLAVWGGGEGGLDPLAHNCCYCIGCYLSDSEK